MRVLNPSIEMDNNNENLNKIVYESENFDEKIKNEYGVGFNELLEQLGE